jgi:cardiolipin synthase
MLNLPNFLTLIRILTIPFFLVYLSYHRYAEALIVFIIGGVTDFLDGLAARLMNQQTALGAYLDPIADKLLVMTSFIMLGLIDGIIYLLVEERLPVKPSRIGKWSTMLQLLTLGVALALLHDESMLDRRLWNVLVAVTAIATVASGLLYLYRGLVWLQNRAPKITRLG